MSRLAIQEKILKIKALRKAIKLLKKQTTPTKNFVSFKNVLEVANSSKHSKHFKKNISRSSILQPTTEEFKKINNKIKKNIKNHKNTKSAQPNKLNKNLKKLESQLDEATIRIVELLDNEILLKETITSNQIRIARLQQERDDYENKYNTMKIKNEYRT